MSSDDQALQGAFRALAEGDRLRRDSDGEAAVRKFEDSLTSARKIQDPDKRARAKNSELTFWRCLDENWKLAPAHPAMA